MSKTDAVKKMMKEANDRMLVASTRDQELLNQFNAAENGIQREQHALQFNMQKLLGEREAIGGLHTAGGVDTQERDALLRDNQAAMSKAQEDAALVCNGLQQEAERLKNLINGEVRPALRAALGRQAFMARRMQAAGLDPNDPAVQATQAAPEAPAVIQAEPEPAAPVEAPVALPA